MGRYLAKQNAKQKPFRRANYKLTMETAISTKKRQRPALVSHFTSTYLEADRRARALKTKPVDKSVVEPLVTVPVVATEPKVRSTLNSAKTFTEVTNTVGKTHEALFNSITATTESEVKKMMRGVCESADMRVGMILPRTMSDAEACRNIALDESYSGSIDETIAPIDAPIDTSLDAPVDTPIDTIQMVDVTITDVSEDGSIITVVITDTNNSAIDRVESFDGSDDDDKPILGCPTVISDNSKEEPTLIVGDRVYPYADSREYTRLEDNEKDHEPRELYVQEEYSDESIYHQEDLHLYNLPKLFPDINPIHLLSTIYRQNVRETLSLHKVFLIMALCHPIKFYCEHSLTLEQALREIDEHDARLFELSNQ
jgi:hypothetical protein